MTHSAPPRGRDDRGAALVEFALVSVLLLTLIFGIIQFGLILSFKQDMTRAAAEGARAAAVAFPASGAHTAAVGATNEAVRGFGGRFSPSACATTGLSCYVNRHDCATTVPRAQPSNNSPTGGCVTVELIYDHGSQPLYGRIPLIEALLPNTIEARSVVRINE